MKDLSTNTNSYNTRIREAISNEYVKCSRQKQEYMIRCLAIEKRLTNEKDTLPYNEYKRLESERELLIEMQKTEDIRLDIWDKAREICLNIADECQCSS